MNLALFSRLRGQEMSDPYLLALQRIQRVDVDIADDARGSSAVAVAVAAAGERQRLIQIVAELKRRLNQLARAKRAR